ncbi:MAG: c-type cytochrome [Bacteroidia bacterium]|nr:c-type cytochrome [Bacteroidia bacterium]MDW8346193.1 cytochrome c peroxidase [Bacteroidia bacterium]
MRLHIPFIISISITFAALVILYACREKKQPTSIGKPITPKLPDYFPKKYYIPENNLLTDKRIELGKMLFFDKSLSKDKTISCASCHLPQYAFSDAGKVFSDGVNGGKTTRNTPMIFNAIYQNNFFMDGRARSLEEQALGPLTHPQEMGMTEAEIVKVVKSNPTYQKMFKECYGDIEIKTICAAIASFERSIVSSSSPYDRDLQGDTTALTPAQKRGRSLFFSFKVGCQKCHNGHLLTNREFMNIGLDENYRDQGLYNITKNESDKGKFMTPSLRNIAITYPYMHDGRFKTLEEVIDFYATGGKNHPNKAPQMNSFTLSPQQKADLIAFLHSLTDDQFIKK